MKKKRPPVPDNDWLRHGASGPVPIGTPSGDRRTFRQTADPVGKELKRHAEATWNTWKRGEPVFRLVTALRTMVTLAMFEGKVPTDLQWISDFFDPEAWFYEPFLGVNQINAGEDNSASLNATLAFTAMQALQVSDTPAWFELRDGLAHSLLATRLTGVRPSDVKMPLPGFYIELPPDLMYLTNNLTGRHEVRALCVAEGCPTKAASDIVASFPIDDSPFRESEDVGYGRRLLIVVFCEPNENSITPEDDNILYFSLPLYDDERTVGELIEYDHTVTGDDWRDDKIGGAFAGVGRTNLQLRNLLRSFVVNFLLYLNAPESDICHKHADHVSKLRKGKTTRRVREQIKRLRRKPFWVVGSRVVVDPSIREAVRHAGTKRGPQKAVNVLVMGYWRKQWSGPKSEECPKGTKCRPKEIKPYVRNKVEGSPVFAHEYKVKNGNGSRK